MSECFPRPEIDFAHSIGLHVWHLEKRWAYCAWWHGHAEAGFADNEQQALHFARKAMHRTKGRWWNGASTSARDAWLRDGAGVIASFRDAPVGLELNTSNLEEFATLVGFWKTDG